MRHPKHLFLILIGIFAVYELFSSWKVNEIYPCGLPSHSITINYYGKLGNNMAEYATLWYYNKILQNTAAFILPEMERALLPVFPNISLPVYRISKSCEDMFISMNGYKHRDIVNLFERNANVSTHVIIRDAPNPVHLYNLYKSDILREFQFSERIFANVQAYQHYLYSIHCKTSRICDSVKHVGIHVRRTDYENWMAEHDRELVSENFFLNAMEEITERMGKLKEGEKLVFIVTSDDSKWCKERFPRHFEPSDVTMNNSVSPSIVYTVDYYPIILQKYLDTYNLFDCTNKGCINSVKNEYVYFDLALLSSMNYNIYDYGSYGFWGAYLSQSKIIIHADQRENPFGPSTMEILLKSLSH